ncbi:hypothetical protein [Peptoniphilus stercorisuis]|uniref:Uncharacterized protein n=1 Tax=Peptoniphilus stercorisuis TaxID=1436965 RepID=A0ABS4KET5_9FIRM|nr:hypothetical protein [Peptoniphilus stercorisuis]MBP2025791.1 hypothetical protein [Peptoniphilus stercorisuis]
MRLVIAILTIFIGRKIGKYLMLKKFTNNQMDLINGKVKSAEISNKDILMGTVSRKDAEKNLSKEEYDNFMIKYLEIFDDDIKKKINIEDFLYRKIRIIAKFDLIAPFNKYSGSEENMFEDGEFDEKRDELRKTYNNYLKENTENKNIIEFETNYYNTYWKGIFEKGLLELNN